MQRRKKRKEEEVDNLQNFLKKKKKKASSMLEGKAIVGETDMVEAMQQDALQLAAKALDSFDVTDATEIARFIKKVRNQTGRRVYSISLTG